MGTWAAKYAPTLFEEIHPSSIKDRVVNAVMSNSPPHMLLSGPSGVGKTTCWQLIARQVLGPGWKNTTHIYQARDRSRTRGETAAFERFLRPEGGDSKDTLAGRMSLDSFDRGFIDSEDGVPPAGIESIPLGPIHGIQPISRILVIEDADCLGTRIQPMLRRILENESSSTRFILTARAPSRIIDALRSRMLHLRFPTTNVVTVRNILVDILSKEGYSHSEGVIEDIAHIANGNLRKGIMLIEITARRGWLTNRDKIQDYLGRLSPKTARIIVDLALRGKTHVWSKKEKGGSVLSGAMGRVDALMREGGLKADEVILRLHNAIISPSLLIDDSSRSKMLLVLSKGDARIRSTKSSRIELERIIMSWAKIGTSIGLNTPNMN